MATVGKAAFRMGGQFRMGVSVSTMNDIVDMKTETLRGGSVGLRVHPAHRLWIWCMMARHGVRGRGQPSANGTPASQKPPRQAASSSSDDSAKDENGTRALLSRRMGPVGRRVCLRFVGEGRVSCSISAPGACGRKDRRRSSLGDDTGGDMHTSDSSVDSEEDEDDDDADVSRISGGGLLGDSGSIAS